MHKRCVDSADHLGGVAIWRKRRWHHLVPWEFAVFCWLDDQYSEADAAAVKMAGLVSGFGLDSAGRVEQTIALYHHKIPAALWQNLRAENLIRADAPIP